MRKNCIRHWVHAICDLLPLLVIPIFALAVRSDNNFQPISIDYGEVTEVTNIEYAYNTNDVTSLNDIVTGNMYHVEQLYFCGYDFYSGDLEDFNLGLKIYNCEGFIFGDNFLEFDEVLFEGYLSGLSSYLDLYIYVENGSSDLTFTFYSGDVYSTYYVDVWYEINAVTLYNVDFIPSDDADFVSFYSFMMSEYNYDLPSSSDYNYISSVTTQTVGTTVTYNDTDVGSQMVYTLYNTCDKYFNFNNVGVFQDLYDWFGTNMFNGSTPPMGFFIVWNVILYEFIMDLIFLTYMVFMFVIDFTEHMIDSFFAKSYRGGR